MAYIDHHCGRCGHVRLAHVRTWCCHGWCRQHCSTRMAEYGPSELIATFAAFGVPNETVTAPGEWVFYSPDVSHALYTCACGECQAKYRELVA